MGMLTRRVGWLPVALIFTSANLSPAAEPWERIPTAAEVAELRKQVAALKGESLGRDSLEAISLRGPDLARLPPIQFRCGLVLRPATDDDLKALARHPGVVVLSLSNSRIADAGLTHLAPLKGLEKLDLTHTALGDAGLADLPPLDSLRVLDLVGTKVTAAGVAHLAGRKLRELILPEAARTDVGLKHYLKAVARFESFDSHYGWPGVTDEGIAVLAGCETLRSLTWWGTEKERLGPTFRKVLPTLTGLESVYLEGTGLVDDDVKLLAALPRLRSLNVSGNEITDAGVRHLAGMKNLRDLNLSRTRVTDAGLKDLARLPALRELFLLNTAVTDTGMRTIAAAPELRELHLEHTAVTSAGVRAFAGRKLVGVWGGPALRTEEVLLVLLPNMRVRSELELGGWPLTDVGLEQVVKHRNLTRLAVQGKFSEKGLLRLAELTELRSLHLATENPPPAALRALDKLEHLNDLTLAGRVSDEALRELAGFRKLTGLTLSGTVTADGLAAVARVEALETLILEDARFTAAGMAALAKSPRLATLSARQSSLDDAGLLALAPVKTLKRIDVSYSAVTGKGKKEFARLRPDCELYEGE